MSKITLQAKDKKIKRVLQIKAEHLVDVSSTGRVRPWDETKGLNLTLADGYDSIDPHKAVRLRSCCEYADFYTPENGKKRFASAFFCRVRLCPVCTWRRSLKVFGQVLKITEAMRQQVDKNYSFLFLTLTVKNVPPHELDDRLNQLFESWHKFVKYKEFKQAVRGWYRGFEITHTVDTSKLTYDTYHPHFHVLLAVNSSYFTDKNYISHARWRELWRQADKLDYDPQVNIKAVKGDFGKAIAELAKYSVKGEDYIIPNDWNLTVETIRLLNHVLDKRRFIAFGGVMKELHKKLRLDDVEKGDLIHVGDDDLPLTDGDLDKIIRYFFSQGYCGYYAVSEI